MPKKRITQDDEPIECSLCGFRIQTSHAKNNKTCPRCNWKIGKRASIVDKDKYAYKKVREEETKALVATIGDTAPPEEPKRKRRKRRTKTEMERDALVKRKIKKEKKR